MESIRSECARQRSQFRMSELRDATDDELVRSSSPTLHNALEQLIVARVRARKCLTDLERKTRHHQAAQANRALHDLIGEEVDRRAAQVGGGA